VGRCGTLPALTRASAMPHPCIEEEHLWKTTIFPAAKPTSRQDVILLERWLDEMTAGIEQKAAGTTDPLGLPSLPPPPLLLLSLLPPITDACCAHHHACASGGGEPLQRC